MRTLNELTRRTDALDQGRPAQAIPGPALPAGCLKEIGDCLARQRPPTEQEKQATRSAGIPFVSPEADGKIREILTKYEVTL